ncbi:hypothetical protein Pint_22395 [Pistacia integerrima]|uniref:Uncharacterized protein n=1 Tax=Pistacia integerrima TaxID=434235 RepID=A0ACC0YKH9_9ROSI|nr:hypothetical protein Pint_22395 [Pistacia integerrima]
MAFSRTPLISFLLISLLFASSMAQSPAPAPLRHLCLLPLPKLDQWLRRLLRRLHRRLLLLLSSSPHRHPLLHRFLLRLQRLLLS